MVWFDVNEIDLFKRQRLGTTPCGEILHFFLDRGLCKSLFFSDASYPSKLSTDDLTNQNRVFIQSGSQ